MNLTDGIVRARHRDPKQPASLIEANEVYEFTIDLWATSNLFKAGHRIRIELSSSNSRASTGTPTPERPSARTRSSWRAADGPPQRRLPVTRAAADRSSRIAPGASGETIRGKAACAYAPAGSCRRPAIQTKPSASMVAAWPVRYQPPAEFRRVRVRVSPIGSEHRRPSRPDCELSRGTPAPPACVQRPARRPPARARPCRRSPA